MTDQERAEKERKKAEKQIEEDATDNRRERVLAMYLSGASFRQIASQMTKSGFSISKSTVERDVNYLLDLETKKKTEDQVKQLERLRSKQIKRYEALILANWGDAIKGDTKKGYLVDTFLQHLTELAGANKPTKVEHEHNINFKDLSDEELQRIADSKS